MLSAEQLQMRLPIQVSHQNAVQLLWSASTVHFHCATIDQSFVVGFDAVIFCKTQLTPFRKRITNTQLEIVHEFTATQTLLLSFLGCGVG